MSSILDALKKAERESTEDDGRPVAWPSLPVDSPVDRPHRLRLWIPLGVIVALFVIASLFWLTRRPASDPQPMVSSRSVEPAPAANNQSVAPTARRSPSATRRERASAPAPQSAARSPQPLLQNESPPDRSPEASSEKRPVPREELQERLSAAGPQPVTAPSEKQARPQAETVQPAEARQPEPPAADPPPESKVIRTDARIDLQALVWAPDAADRFVVINNRLLKEGGSIEKITVVRINQDDVLLAEGNDRWHQEFKIR